MKRISAIALCVILGFFTSTSLAEIYQGIRPGMSVGNVKKLFPGATFKKVLPAWMKGSNAMYSITGLGISGTIVVSFVDIRPGIRKFIEEDPSNRKILQKMVEGSDDDSLTASWVRWIPTAPFPLERMVAKYGEPDKSGYSSDDFTPYKMWVSRGIMADLSGDEKLVTSIEYNFTEKEWEQAKPKP